MKLERRDVDIDKLTAIVEIGSKGGSIRLRGPVSAIALCHIAEMRFATETS